MIWQLKTWEENKHELIQQYHEDDRLLNQEKAIGKIRKIGISVKYITIWDKSAKTESKK